MSSQVLGKLKSFRKRFSGAPSSDRGQVRRDRSNMAEEYPRPDFQREKLNWKSLNGQWGFMFDDADVGLTQRWYDG
jgi:hypothetical protein